MNYIEVGKKIEPFEAIDQNGQKISLKQFEGKKNIVLYLYPKDNTPGCTNEACDFRDRVEFFDQLDTVIIGISPDSLKSHQKFSSKYELPFPILSDTEKDYLEKIGVWQLKKNFGKEYYGVVRTTYIIDKEGVVQKIFKRVKVKEHAQKVLEYIKNNLI